MKDICKVLFIFGVMFSITIHNVTLLPNIIDSSVRGALVLATILVTLSGMYLVYHYQIKNVSKLKKECKNKE